VSSSNAELFVPGGVVRVVLSPVRSRANKFLALSWVVFVLSQRVSLLWGFLPPEGEWRVLAWVAAQVSDLLVLF
jgi:hypothetical protein